MSEPQTNNRYPGCVAMKLHLKPEQSSAQPSMLARFRRNPAVTPANTVRVGLTITFGGQQEIDIPKGQQLGLPGGGATFSLRRGQLKLALQNCTMPPDKRSLSAEDTQSDTKAGATEVLKVTGTGSEENPTWTFEPDGAHYRLEGTLEEQILGLLSVVTSPYEINATFTVQGEDIRVDWGELGETQNIHRNKLAVIKRGIVLRYLKPLLEDAPLCDWRGCHD